MRDTAKQFLKKLIQEADALVAEDERKKAEQKRKEEERETASRRERESAEAVLNERRKRLLKATIQSLDPSAYAEELVTYHTIDIDDLRFSIVLAGETTSIWVGWGRFKPIYCVSDMLFLEDLNNTQGMKYKWVPLPLTPSIRKEIVEWLKPRAEVARVRAAAGLKD